MGVSLRQLATSMYDDAQEFEKIVNREAREIVVETHRVFASGVPVDTGQARSNTRGSSALATPSNVIPPYVPGVKLGIAETGNLNAANAQCRRAAKVWKASGGARKPFVIFNNWPEIERLNNGDISSQGRHFVQRAEKTARRLIRKARWYR